MKVKRAAVFANEKKGVARQVKREVISFLRLQGIALSRHPQLVITIGGDGTALFNKRHYGVPYFAIGSGTSFICQADFSDWKGKLARVLPSLRTEERLLLECSINERRMPLALNEVGVRSPAPRVLSFHLEVAGRQGGKQMHAPRGMRGGISARLARRGPVRARAAPEKLHFAFRADGVIFSTPTGSPAYCYSCGGRQMKKTETRYQAVAIAPFRRQFSPIILANGAECSLRINGHDRAQFFIDGQDFGSLPERGTLRVKASGKKFLFARV